MRGVHRPSRFRSRPAVAVLLLACVAYFCILILSALTRKPWNDEAMAASAAYTLAHKGFLGTPVFDDFYLLHIQKVTYFIFPLWMCVLAPVFRLVGATLTAMRGVSIVCSAVVLAALYTLMARWTHSRPVALLAVGIAAFDYQFLTAASFGRYDMLVAALGFAAYAIYLGLRATRLGAALLLSNCCLMAAAATHPNALVYLIGLAFLVLHSDRRRLGLRELALAAAPYAIGSAVWACYILQDTTAFVSQLTANAGHRSLLFRPLEALKEEIVGRYLREFGLLGHSAGRQGALIRLKAAPLMAYFAGVACCLTVRTLRTDPRHRVLFLLSLIHFCYLTFYEGMKFSYYLVHLLPFYACLLAIAADWAWRAAPRGRPWIAAAVATMVAVEVGGMMLKARIDDYATSFAPAAAYLTQHAAPADLVMGSCSLWFSYGPERNLIDDDSLGFASGKHPRYVVFEEIYADSLSIYAANRPAVAAHIRRILAASQLVYDREHYKIYKVADTAWTN